MWRLLLSLFRPAKAVAQAAAPTVKKAAPALALAAAAFIGTWEGRDLVAVRNSFDPPGVITYCQGLTNIAEDKSVKVGQRFTPEVCDKKFAAALPKYIDPVKKCVPNIGEYPQGVQVASISLAYNIGTGVGSKTRGFCNSNVARYLKEGNRQKACDSFRLYNTARNNKGQRVVLKGLVNRREAERKLCLGS